MEWLTLTIVFVNLIFVEGGTVDNPFVLHPSMAFPHERPSFCVTSCAGLPDGNYHSCKGCYYFATCSKGVLFDGRKCAAFGAVWWNDYRKRCDFSSPSCHKMVRRPEPISVPGFTCVNNCLGMRNGDYHSCSSCRTYITCTNGFNVDRRPCPWFLEWDDRRKRCEWYSTTCTLPRTSPGPPALWTWFK
ncbi:hypothetical protein ACF0H5_012140 [Mactra antiquata]